MALGNKDNFTRIARQLEDYHLIIPDLLGFGEFSKPMTADYRADAQAERLHELMQAKGVASNIHVGGNSMGGAISVAYAAKYPKEVKSLWLIDSTGFWSAGVPKSLKRNYSAIPSDYDARSRSCTNDRGCGANS